MEFHNTYLEILAMTGVVGFFIFAKFSLRIYRVLKSDYTLYLIVLPLYAYGLAGFSDEAARVLEPDSTGRCISSEEREGRESR